MERHVLSVLKSELLKYITHYIVSQHNLVLYDRLRQGYILVWYLLKYVLMHMFVKKHRFILFCPYRFSSI